MCSSDLVETTDGHRLTRIMAARPLVIFNRRFPQITQIFAGATTGASLRSLGWLDCHRFLTARGRFAQISADALILRLRDKDIGRYA